MSRFCVALVIFIAFHGTNAHELRASSRRASVPLTKQDVVKAKQALLSVKGPDDDISTDPIRTPRNVSEAAATSPVQEIEEEEKALEEGYEPKTHHGWKLEVATWVVMLVITAFAHVTMKQSHWKPSHRAPYTAALLYLWNVTIFATIFFNSTAHDWSFLECLYFVIVTVTTVGYGDYVPSGSTADRVVLLILIWFNIFVLSIILGLVSGAVDEEAEGKKGEGWHWLVLHMVGLIAIGAVIFSQLEGWTLLQGVTFCTVTLSTVGYGALLPKNSMAFACVFILFGVPAMGCMVGKISGMIDDSFKGAKAKMSQKKLLAVYIGIIVGWLFFGAFMYRFVNGHGWGWTDSLYLSAVTMTTVGYGDLVPEKNNMDLIATNFFIWGSVIIIAAVFSDLDALLLDDLTAGMKKHKKVLTKWGILGVILAVGCGVMMNLEGWNFGQAFQFTSVTCTTVGYGHLLPTSATAKMFMVPFLLASVPMTGCIVSSISDQYSDEISTLVADAD